MSSARRTNSPPAWHNIFQLILRHRHPRPNNTCVESPLVASALCVSALSFLCIALNSRAAASTASRHLPTPHHRDASVLLRAAPARSPRGAPGPRLPSTCPPPGTEIPSASIALLPASAPRWPHPRTPVSCLPHLIECSARSTALP